MIILGWSTRSRSSIVLYVRNFPMFSVETAPVSGDLTVSII